MRERSPMESIRGLGNITGDYVGDGQGDCVSMVNVPNETENSHDIISEDTGEVQNDEEVTSDLEPLFILYDLKPQD